MWALVIIIIIGSSGVAIESVPMASKEICEAAAAQLKGVEYKYHENATPTRPVDVAVCIRTS